MGLMIVMILSVTLYLQASTDAQSTWYIMLALVIAVFVYIVSLQVFRKWRGKQMKADEEESGAIFVTPKKKAKEKEKKEKPKEKKKGKGADDLDSQNYKDHPRLVAESRKDKQGRAETDEHCRARH